MYSLKKKIFVLDVHASEAGALSILDDFYEQVKASDSDQFDWTFMVSSPQYEQTENIKIIRYPWIKKTWIHRFLFDTFWAKRIIKLYKPDLIINLQNKCVKIEKCPQIVYLHLPFILTDFKFVLFKHELRLWFYQKVLKKIIFKSYRDGSKVIVQTSWMKNALVSQSEISKDQVEVIPPTVSLRFKEDIAEHSKVTNRNIFYPATAFSYKNHMVILEAMNHLSKTWAGKIRAEFTILAQENKHTRKLYDYSLKNNLDVTFLGKLNRGEVIERLLSNGLVFPSFIESFGLPLLEARVLGVPIIAIDAPFSREILDGYEQVAFFDGNSHTSLAACLIKFDDMANNLNDDSPEDMFYGPSILDAIKSHFHEQ